MVMRYLTCYVLPLAGHAVKSRLRETSGAALVAGLASRGLMYAVSIGVGFATGSLAEHWIDPGHDGGTHDLAGGYLVYMSAALFVVCTVAPMRSRLDLTPYRYLPLSRMGVALVGTLLDLVRKPFALYVSLMGGLAVGDAGTGGSAVVVWTVGAGSLGAGAVFLGTRFRSTLLQRPLTFASFVMAGVVVVVADKVLESDLLREVSRTLEGALASGEGWSLALSFAVAAASLYAAAFGGADVMRGARGACGEIDSTAADRRGSPVRLYWLCAGDPALRNASLELLMLIRCAYPRYQARGIGILLTCLLLLTSLIPEDAYRLVTILFVVCGFAATYAQVAFAWNSEHFHGLFSLPADATAHILARWMVGALLALPTTIVIMLVSMTVVDGHTLAAIASCLFTIGSIIPLLILMSIRWSRRIVLHGSGISNMKAYTWHLYAAVIAMWMGSQLLLTVTSEKTALLFYAATGLLGIFLSPLIARRLALELTINLPSMAERLRTRP